MGCLASLHEGVWAALWVRVDLEFGFPLPGVLEVRVEGLLERGAELRVVLLFPLERAVGTPRCAVLDDHDEAASGIGCHVRRGFLVPVLLSRQAACGGRVWLRYPLAGVLFRQAVLLGYKVGPSLNLLLLLEVGECLRFQIYHPLLALVRHVGPMHHCARLQRSWQRKSENRFRALVAHEFGRHLARDKSDILKLHSASTLKLDL
eukprot:scaffold82322_cov66-Phaeocystis_antarctica.AAC.3